MSQWIVTDKCTFKTVWRQKITQRYNPTAHVPGNMS